MRNLAIGVAAVVLGVAASASAATLALSAIANNSTCVVADADDGNDSEQAYNTSNAACSEQTGGSDGNFFRVSNSGITSASAVAGDSTSLGFTIDAGVGVDSAVDGQDEYERGKVRYTLNFSVTATQIEDWSVDLSQSILGLYGFAGDGSATAVGTQVFGNAGLSPISVAVGATNVGFTAAPAAASSNVANTGTESAGPFSGSRTDTGVVSGRGNGSFAVTISFDIDAFSNAGCTGFICSSASGGEDAAVLLGYDNVDDCCGGTSDRIKADDYATWGRTAAPDGYNSTFTFKVSTTCGNGVVDGTEQCDQGGDNGAATSCCTSLCTRRPSGATCRPPAGPCDVADTCDGVSPTCPADAFASPSVVCRAVSSGDVCDIHESCTGDDPNCPADAVRPAGTICRTGSGDTCDPTESCDGTGKSCPTDTVRPSGTVCRAGSGDACDVAETCTGIPGAACPANDAPGRAGQVCRAGSGDSCDVNETCTGTPGQTCPANDAPGKAGTVCRAGSGDACDPSETCTGTPGAACPVNAVAARGTVCRAATGACDVAETCPGTAGQACPANVFAADGSSCSDGLFCNGAETCQAGTCVDRANPCASGCDEGTHACVAGCPAAPLAGCRTADKSQLQLRDATPDSGDSLQWKWYNGDATGVDDFGDPTTEADMALCIYTGTPAALLTDAVVPAGDPSWRAVNGTGYSYASSAGSADGIQRILLKASPMARRTKVSWAGRGAFLVGVAPGRLPLANSDFPVRVQMLNSATAVCFESTFDQVGVSTNRPDQLKLTR